MLFETRDAPDGRSFVLVRTRRRRSNTLVNASDSSELRSKLKSVPESATRRRNHVRVRRFAPV